MTTWAYLFGVSKATVCRVTCHVIFGPHVDPPVQILLKYEILRPPLLRGRKRSRCEDIGYKRSITAMPQSSIQEQKSFRKPSRRNLKFITSRQQDLPHRPSIMQQRMDLPEMAPNENHHQAAATTSYVWTVASLLLPLLPAYVQEMILILSAMLKWK